MSTKKSTRGERGRKKHNEHPLHVFPAILPSSTFLSRRVFFLEYDLSTSLVRVLFSISIVFIVIVVNSVM